MKSWARIVTEKDLVSKLLSSTLVAAAVLTTSLLSHSAQAATRFERAETARIETHEQFVKSLRAGEEKRQLEVQQMVATNLERFAARPEGMGERLTAQEVLSLKTLANADEMLSERILHLAHLRRVAKVVDENAAGISNTQVTSLDLKRLEMSQLELSYYAARVEASGLTREVVVDLQVLSQIGHHQENVIARAKSRAGDEAGALKEVGYFVNFLKAAQNDHRQGLKFDVRERAAAFHIDTSYLK